MSGIRFGISRKRLREERLLELKERDMTIELNDIAFNIDSIVIDANMWFYGREYWLMASPDDRDTSVKKMEGTRSAIFIERAWLICQDGVPLKVAKKTTKELRARGAKLRKLWVLR